MPKEHRQAVRFLFLKLDPTWRRLPAGEQAQQKEEFGRTIKSFHAKLLLRTYSTVGTRGDCDLLLWQAAENVESNYGNAAENVEATTSNAAEAIESNAANASSEVKAAGEKKATG